LGTSSSSNLEHVLPRLGSIGSLVWELLVPRTGSPWFQDWEALVRTFGNQLFELGKIGKHSFERLGTAILELGTRGSKIGKHWLERLGTSSFLNGEPVVLRLGRIGSNVWEPAVPLLSQPIRTAKKGVSETFSIWGLCRCNFWEILIHPVPYFLGSI